MSLGGEWHLKRLKRSFKAPPNNEFEIIPSRGTLLPNCAQRIQVDFISNTEKKYDTRR